MCWSSWQHIPSSNNKHKSSQKTWRRHGRNVCVSTKEFSIKMPVPKRHRNVTIISQLCAVIAQHLWRRNTLQVLSRLTVYKSITHQIYRQTYFQNYSSSIINTSLLPGYAYWNKRLCINNIFFVFLISCVLYLYTI